MNVNLTRVFSGAIVALAAFSVAYGGELTDSRDGLVYQTAKIGDQEWMAENLNFKTKASRCFDDVEENCQQAGALYTWAEALSACPDGWRLPTGDEFNTLIATAGGEKVAGGRLKSSDGWKKNNGQDDVGFTAWPVGFFDPERDSYRYWGDRAFFWSSSEENKYVGNMLDLSYTSQKASVGRTNKGNFIPVRCIKGK